MSKNKKMILIAAVVLLIACVVSFLFVQILSVKKHSELFESQLAANNISVNGGTDYVQRKQITSMLDSCADKNSDGYTFWKSRMAWRFSGYFLSAKSQVELLALSEGEQQFFEKYKNKTIEVGSNSLSFSVE